MIRQALQQAGYAPHRATGVLLPSNGKIAPFNYSDGDVEAAIYEQLTTVSDLACGSQELAALITDWPRQYHFAPQRADLLRPLEHLLMGNVLEIGAGCGAISRYLGETAQQVVSLEGALRRAVIARKRCQELHNVQVVCAHAMEFKSMPLFDAVVLVGVLEYSRCFVNAEDPIQAMLDHCRSFLKPGGVLIVAIENQLGLKYFSGAPEDHVNEPYFGINDRYAERTVVTFGKHELTTRLTNAGFEGTRFFYPFPDYKIPTAVLTEEGAHNTSETMQNVAASFNARSIHNGYHKPFSEERAWPLLLRNQTLAPLANSFLVVARQTPITAQDDVIRSSGDLGYVYSTSRKRQFAKETTLTASGDSIHITRRRLYPNLEPVDRALVQVIENEQAVQGAVYSRVLGQVINTPGWSVEDVAQWARPWLDFLEAHKVPGDGDSKQQVMHVPGTLIDCSPGNLIVQGDNKLAGFDFEWQVDMPIPAAWPLFRGMFYALYNHSSVAKPAETVSPRVIDIVQDTMKALGLPAGAKDLEQMLRLENAFFNINTDAVCQARITQRPS